MRDAHCNYLFSPHPYLTPYSTHSLTLAHFLFLPPPLVYVDVVDVVLVYANKQDLPGALGPKELATSLGLDKLRNRQWFIQSSNAVTGDGLYEGLDWMVKTINTVKRTTSS